MAAKKALSAEEIAAMKDADRLETERKAKERADFVKAHDTNHGLTDAQAQERILQYGYNVLDEKKRNKLLLFLSFFWGPMPVMIWVAIIIELAQAIITGEAWPDFGVLMALQFANAIVGFIEENNAGNAIDALKNQLAPMARVIRGGKHFDRFEARNLVPGDIVDLAIGDIIPADCILLEGKPVQVDQSALTGESLPVKRSTGEVVLMSSALKQGDIKAIVYKTAKQTEIGKAAHLISGVKHQSNLHKILLNITIVLVVICIVACAAIFARLMTTEDPPTAVWDGAGDSKFLRSLSVVVVILVASIPVAIEVVVTSTMAVGSRMMAAKKVIVARLSAIEELAGMTVLCSDKTGTLTLNKLSLRTPIIFDTRWSEADLFLYSALASKVTPAGRDAIEYCIFNKLAPTIRKQVEKEASEGPRPLGQGYEQLDFTPFNPHDKRTVAKIRGPDGRVFLVSKGAPQVSLRMAWNSRALEERVSNSITELANAGFRSLGVAVSFTNPDAGEPERWEFLGILSLYDPPRPDSADTIASALENGIMVKMITGDHDLIAVQTCKDLRMAEEPTILKAHRLDEFSEDSADVKAIANEGERNAEIARRKKLKLRLIMEATGFAEVMPEHKFAIVQSIREAGHIVGMTGDGVNDAPALKRADIGIAVHGATDAARAAAAIVLTDEGISVIITAIYESRKIFQRMRNYIIYRIACTLQLLFFFFFGILCINADGSYMYQGIYPPEQYIENSAASHAPVFSLPVLSLVFITVLNDACMITISSDEVKMEAVPQSWNMPKVWATAVVLGGVACFSSLILLSEGMHANYLNPGTIVGTLWGGGGRTYLTWFELKTILYLKVSISDFLTLFSARTHGWFWERRLATPLFCAFLFATGCSTIFALVWGDMFPTQDHMASLRYSPGAVVCTWVYCILWWFVQDAAKVGAHSLFDKYWVSNSERTMKEHAKNFQDRPTVPKAQQAAAIEAAAAAIIAESDAAAGGAPAAAAAAASTGTGLSDTLALVAQRAGLGNQGTFGRVAGTVPVSRSNNGSVGSKSSRRGSLAAAAAVAAAGGDAAAVAAAGPGAGESAPSGTRSIDHTVSKPLVPAGVSIDKVIDAVQRTLTQRTATQGRGAESARPALAGLFAAPAPAAPAAVAVAVADAAAPAVLTEVTVTVASESKTA